MIRYLEAVWWDLWAVDCIYSQEPPTPERRARVAELLAEEREMEVEYWESVREELATPATD